MSAKFPIRVKTVECVLTKWEVTNAAVNLDTTETTVNTVFANDIVLLVFLTCIQVNNLLRKFVDQLGNVYEFCYRPELVQIQVNLKMMSRFG